MKLGNLLVDLKAAGALALTAASFVVAYAPGIVPLIPSQYAQAVALVVGIASAIVSAQHTTKAVSTAQKGV